MTRCQCSCAVTCIAVLFAIFLLLDVISFVATIGLAWYGIEEADRENSCRVVNTTQDCVPFIELGPSLNAVSSAVVELGRIQGFNYDLYVFWMIGATVCGLLWACINVATLISLSELIKVHLGVLKKVENDAKEVAHEMKHIAHTGETATAEGTDDDKSVQLKPIKPKSKSEMDEFVGPDNIRGFTDQVGGVYTTPEWVNEPMRHFGPLSALSLLVSSILFVCAILCLVWGIAISFNHARRDERSALTFVLVEFLVAILLPVFLSSSVAFFAVVLEFVTIGHADLRTFIPRLVNMISFQIGQKYDYWVIDKTFYYPLEKKEGRKKKGCCFSVDKDPATWLIAIIIGCAFHLVISYFVDLTLDAQITVTSCDDPLIDRSYDCFNASTLNFVDCVDNTDTNLLHCFKFYRFGVETNIITAITTSYAFYLVTIAAFRQIYAVVRNLEHIKPSRYWGVGLVAVGVIFYCGSVIVSFFWALGIAADTIAELRRINIIHLFQFFVVSTFVTMVGALLLTKWYEKLNTKAHAKIVQLPLVHYSDTQRKYIHQIESLDKDKWPPNSGESQAADVETTRTQIP